MLVVSNIDLTTNIRVMKPSTFLEERIKENTININYEYRYMKTGYYVSLHAEILGNKVIPSCENIIDTSRTPILLLRAKKAKIPTLPFIVTDSVKKISDEFGYPTLVFAVNPFIYNGYKTATNKSSLYRIMKSLGMNYKFAVCAQPLKGKIVSFKSIFGKCTEEKGVQIISEKVYQLFRIPLCKLHVQIIEEKAYLCGLQPLDKNDLLTKDLKTLSTEISLISKQGEPFSA